MEVMSGKYEKEEGYEQWGGGGWVKGIPSFLVHLSSPAILGGNSKGGGGEKNFWLSVHCVKESHT